MERKFFGISVEDWIIGGLITVAAVAAIYYGFFSPVGPQP